MSRASAKRIGEPNEQLILNEVRRRRRASVGELVRYTRRSQPTILKWLATLERDGFLIRHGYGESNGGRPPALFQFKADREHMLGIAVEIPSVHAVVIDLNGKVLATEYWKMDLHPPVERVLDDLGSRVEHFLRNNGAVASKIATCGSALSGFLDRETGVSLATPRVPGWQNVPVRGYLTVRLGMPVTLNHHIDALMLAELSCGVAKSWQNFLYFDVGYGLGIRLVKAGQPVHGMYGNAGLIGHTTIVPNGRRCVCGNAGCLEEYVSLRALLRQLPLPPAGSGSRHSFDGDMEELVIRLFSIDSDNDGRISDLKRETCEFLSIGLANAINVFDLPQVVVSGFITRSSERFREQLIHGVKARLQQPLAQSVEIAYASVPRTLAGALGAALFALQRRLPGAEPLIVGGDLQEGGDEQPFTPMVATG